MNIAMDTNNANEKIAMQTLFSYLDKGIDDVETGRVYDVDTAFQMIKDRLDIEF